MWSSKLDEFNKNNKQILNLKLDLHIAIYILKIFKDKIQFSINENKSKTKKTLMITINDDQKDKNITKNKFYYWYQIDLFNELYSEEAVIFNEFNDMKNKISEVINKIEKPVILDSDSEEIKTKKQNKIDDNHKKIEKLNKHLKQSADKSNMSINELKRLRLMFPTHESIEKLLDNILIILENE